MNSVSDSLLHNVTGNEQLKGIFQIYTKSPCYDPKLIYFFSARPKTSASGLSVWNKGILTELKTTAWSRGETRIFWTSVKREATHGGYNITTMNPGLLQPWKQMTEAQINPELTLAHSSPFAFRIKPLICSQNAKLPSAHKHIYSEHIPTTINKPQILQTPDLIRTYNHIPWIHKGDLRMQLVHYSGTNIQQTVMWHKL